MKFKRYLTFLILTFAIAQNVSAQTTLNLETTTDSSIGPLPKGNSTIERISYELDVSWGNWTYKIYCKHQGRDYKVSCREMFNKYKLKFTPITNNLQNYWDCVNISSLAVVSSIENLYSLRYDIEEEAYNYAENLRNNGLIFDDPYLESYIYSIIAKISPIRRPDGFPYDIKLVILKDDSMNACILPNGLLVINVGLLAALKTEDELAAILSHEVAHYVANHALVNIKKTRDREARAAAWGILATTMAAATEVYAASQGAYVNGSLTFNTAVLSSIIAQEITDNLGLNFSREQEEDADKMALEILKFLNYDQNALATAFNRMAQSYNEEGNWASYYLSGDHPSLATRIEYSGTPYSRIDNEFEKKVSFAITNAAIVKFQQGRFSQALQYTERNIANGVATDDDYLIKALCSLYLKNTVESNAEASKCINLAKTYNPNNPNIRRTEIICNLRENKKDSALSNLNKYIEELDNNLTDVSEESIAYSYYISERDWARKMLIKTKGI